MKYVFVLFSLLLIVEDESFAQEQPGAGQIALAHSDVSSVNDVFSLFNNPAGLALLKAREIGFYYSLYIFSRIFGIFYYLYQLFHTVYISNLEESHLSFHK